MKREKIQKKSRMASPRRGDDTVASLVLPAGKVKNVGGLLARFERAFKKNPNDIPNLNGWEGYLFDLFIRGPRGDPNAERAIRLAGDVHQYLDEVGDTRR
jgi:hypothetical protein